MSAENFPIDEKQVQDTQTATSGRARITVSFNGTTHEFESKEAIGGLDWNLFSAEYVEGSPRESFRVDYGYTLPEGDFFSAYPYLRCSYVSPDGIRFPFPGVKAGSITASVQRSESGADFQIKGKIENVKLEWEGSEVILNGSYDIGSGAA
nr:hypothetical protein [uncultured Pseudomonas sp.]